MITVEQVLNKKAKKAEKENQANANEPIEKKKFYQTKAFKIGVVTVLLFSAYYWWNSRKEKKLLAAQGIKTDVTTNTDIPQ